MNLTKMSTVGAEVAEVLLTDNKQELAMQKIKDKYGNKEQMTNNSFECKT